MKKNGAIYFKAPLLFLPTFELSWTFTYCRSLNSEKLCCKTIVCDKLHIAFVQRRGSIIFPLSTSTRNMFLHSEHLYNKKWNKKAFNFLSFVPT